MILFPSYFNLTVNAMGVRKIANKSTSFLIPACVIARSASVSAA
jgi:hypothetical protein